LQQYRDEVVTIAATMAELRDLDTPDDLRNG
jgi:hypothetical protein